MTVFALCIAWFAVLLHAYNAWERRRFKKRNPYDPTLVSDEEYAELMKARKPR